MKTISPGKEPIVSMWKATSNRISRYRLMKYCVRTECQEESLLLNTVTGELVLLSNEETKLLETLPHDYDSRMDTLITHHFLVPEGADELSSVRQLRKILRSLTNPRGDVTGFMILPTTMCNARCFYCYESDYPHCSMSDETTELLIDYIETHCGGRKSVRLSWFGGEPTLGEKRIDYICDSLETRGINFSSSMISNGYLFSEEMAHKAKEKWRLRNIQITLDGTEEIYNSVKAYVNPKGNPYQEVINNIGVLMNEKIRVTIRINLDGYNADNLKQLIDELAERFRDHNLFSVYVHEIFENMGYEPVHRSGDGLKDIIEKKLMLDSYIAEKGLKLSKGNENVLPSLKLTYCMADNPASVLVNPYGQLGKCQHMQFEHLIGDLHQDGIINKNELQYWLTYQPKVGCDDCPLLPSCGIPETCVSGRACTPQEKSRELDLVCRACSKIFVNING